MNGSRPGVYECVVCGFLYDESTADVPFKDLPDSWECPVCGAAIQRIVYADNECDYCPVCQTEGRILADRSLSRLLKSDWPQRVDDLG